MPLPTPVPELSDGTVRLRAHTLDDLDAVVALCTDPTTQRWTTVPRPYDADQAHGFITGFVPAGWADGTDLTWAVEATDEAGVPRFAGNLSLRPGPPADLGFALHPWARGRGVMTAAVRLASTYAFVAGHEVVQWQCEAGNLASWRVAWACGFTFTGTQPAVLPGHDGRLRDGWRALLRPGDDVRTPTTRWLEPPVLPAGAYRLRPNTVADVPRIVEACRDPRTQHWLVQLPRDYTEVDAHRFLVDGALGQSLGQQFGWAVVDPADDLILARLVVFELTDVHSPGSAEIGYWAHPEARGRGVTGEAARAVADWCLTPAEAGGLGLHRMTLLAVDGNDASVRVAGHAGFSLVGRQTAADTLGDGSRHDLLTFQRLA